MRSTRGDGQVHRFGGRVMAARKQDASTDVTTDSSDDTLDTVDVEVTEPFQVNKGGRVYGPGDTVPDVDADTALQWQRAGFVTTTSTGVPRRT